MSNGSNRNKTSTGRKRTGYDPSRLILDAATAGGVDMAGSASSATPSSSSSSSSSTARGASSSSSSSSASSRRLGSLRSTAPDLTLSSSSSSAARGRDTARFRPNVGRATAGPTRFMPNIPSSSSVDAVGAKRGSQQQRETSKESKFRPNLRGAKSRRGGSSSRGGRRAAQLPSLASGGGLMTQQFLGSVGLGGGDSFADIDRDPDAARSMDDVKNAELLDQKRQSSIQSGHHMFENMRNPPRIVPAPGSLVEEVFDTATSSSNSVQATQLDEAEARATRDLFRYNIERLMSEDQLFFIQLPSSLPVAASRKPKTETGKGKKDGKTAMSKDEEYESIWTTAFESTLTKVPAGYMGEMVVHKSGKTKLKLGGDESQIAMDVLPGSNFSFLEHVVAISPDNAQSYVLGEVAKRISIVPSIEELLLDGKK